MIILLDPRLRGDDKETRSRFAWDDIVMFHPRFPCRNQARLGKLEVMARLERLQHLVPLEDLAYLAFLENLEQK